MSKVSVIICSFDDDLRLALTLWGWAGQLLKPQLIVVNDGGDEAEKTEALVRSYEKYFPRLDYVYVNPSKKEMGGQVFRLAASRNVGLRRAVGELTIISDCDTIPRPDVTALMWNSYRENRVLIGTRKRIPMYMVAGLTREHFPYLEQLVHADDERLINPKVRDTFLDLKDSDNPVAWDLCWGCCFAAPTKHFKALGGFDERHRTWGGEDTSMAERLGRGAGCKFLVMPEVVVYHLDHEKRCPHPYVADKVLEEIRANWSPIANGGPLS